MKNFQCYQDIILKKDCNYLIDYYFLQLNSKVINLLETRTSYVSYKSNKRLFEEKSNTKYLDQILFGLGDICQCIFVICEKLNINIDDILRANTPVNKFLPPKLAIDSIGLYEEYFNKYFNYNRDDYDINVASIFDSILFCSANITDLFIRNKYYNQTLDINDIKINFNIILFQVFNIALIYKFNLRQVLNYNVQRLDKTEIEN